MRVNGYITVYTYTGAAQKSKTKKAYVSDRSVIPEKSEVKGNPAAPEQPAIPDKSVIPAKTASRRPEKAVSVIFEKRSNSPYSESNPIPLDEAIPWGVFYRIQLGAFSKEVPPDTFGGLSPISGERIEERGLIKYYAGKFSHYADASMALQQVKTSGYPDAFIVSYYNGENTSLSRARSLEQ